MTATAVERILSGHQPAALTALQYHRPVTSSSALGSHSTVFWHARSPAPRPLTWLAARSDFRSAHMFWIVDTRSRLQRLRRRQTLVRRDDDVAS